MLDRIIGFRLSKLLQNKIQSKVRRPSAVRRPAADRRAGKRDPQLQERGVLDPGCQLSP